MRVLPIRKSYWAHWTKGKKRKMDDETYMFYYIHCRMIPNELKYKNTK